MNYRSYVRVKCINTNVDVDVFFSSAGVNLIDVRHDNYETVGDS